MVDLKTYKAVHIQAVVHRKFYTTIKLFAFRQGLTVNRLIIKALEFYIRSFSLKPGDE